MKHADFNYKTRLLLTAGALFVFSVVPAQAQTSAETSQLMNRLNQLENQIQTMSRAVYKGDASAAAALGSTAGSSATAAANYEVRISDIEEQQRKLTGQLEKINYDLQQLKDRLDRMQADNEQRLQQIEHGAGAAPSAAPAAPNTVVTPEPAAAPASTATGGTLGTLSSSGGNNGPAEALYEAAFANVRDSQYEDAETKFKQFMSQYPGHPLTPNAQYWLGETYYVRGDFKQAAKTFAQGYQDYPKSSKAADSLFKLGLSLSKLGKKEDACLSLRQLQKEFVSDSPLLRKTQDQIKQLACP